MIRSLVLSATVFSFSIAAPLVAFAQQRSAVFADVGTRPVAAVPEPGAALLFGAGLVVAAAVSRRKR